MFQEERGDLVSGKVSLDEKPVEVCRSPTVEQDYSVKNEPQQHNSESVSSVSDVLSKLRGVRKSGSGWSAKCPAHDDQKNSLSVSVGDGGRVLLHCHAGCPYGRIAALVGLTANDNKAHRIVKVYDYRDRDGVSLYQVVRFEPKGFAVRRPDGCGGFIYNIKNVPRVLYRLPELLATRLDQPVLIVEGEKDADRLSALGFIITTNFGGSSKWHKEYSKELQGRRVVIIPDNDDAGRAHAQQVARSLIGIAASVKIVELPGMPPKGDVSDYLDAGNTAEALRDLINAAPSESHKSGISTSYGRRKTHPILNDKALYGLAGEFVATIFPHTEADKAALLVQMLVAFGNIIGRGPYYVAESTRHHMNLYTLVVGVTSAAKGSSLKQVRNVLDRVDEAWALDCNKSGLSSGEGLVEAISETDKRLFLREAEFASALAKQSRDASVLSATLRELWDEGNARVMNRKHNALSATDAHVSLVGHITPEELMQRLSITDLANGYANRFLFACVRRSKDLADGGNLLERDVNTLVMKIQRAKQFAEGVREMKRDEYAAELWRAVYPRLVEDKNGMFGKVVARARAQVLRLSCLYALLDHSTEVRRPHLEAALALWQYCEDSARYIFAEGLTLSVNAQKLYDAVCEAGDAGLSRTAQSQIFKGNLTAKELDAITDELIKAELVTEVRTDGSRKAGLVVIKSDGLDELDELDSQEPLATSSTSLIRTSDEQAEAEAVRDLYYRSE
jgi:Protein of unknown function (DUF3987)